MAPLLHHSSSFLRLILLCCFLICEVDVFGTHVQLDVLLTRFSNPQNRNALNQCCDGKRDAKTCSDSCDIFFVVCVLPPKCAQEPSSGVILRNGSEFIYSQVNFTSASGSTLGNFLSVDDFAMNPQTVNLFCIHFYDDDSTLGRPGNRSSYEAVANFTQTLPTSINSLSIHRNFSKNNISIEILYRLKCAKYYHGELCDIYCMPKENKYTHTICLANGTKRCHPKWEGIRCSIPKCPGGCNGGSCVKPDHCSCKDGWTGASCTECVPSSECVHATCTDPQKCDCETNWSGQFCNIYKNYCLHYNPCKNGRCSQDVANTNSNFTCTCLPGWTGPTCDISLCPSSCNCSNADPTKPYECSCIAGWTGPNCTECVASVNCLHGHCNRPLECLCEKGWGGENCSDPTRISNCSQLNPCRNDGKCKGGKCVCKRGFTGRYCQDKDSCLTRCNKGHGYCKDNECRCYSGWRGRNCTECVKHSSCVNGFCRRPFECSCNESWTGPFCNINVNDSTTTGSNRTNSSITERFLESDESISDIDRLIYILSSVLVLLIIACILCLVWWYHRRRARYHVSSSEVVANSMVRPPLYKRDQGKTMLGLNNNVTVKPSEIVLNPMTLQPSHNSRSTLIDNEPELFESRCINGHEDNSPDSTEYCIIK